jgi:hypothetical protein
MLEWYPQVVVDLHEMGGNSTYYFAPPADPINPLITEAQRKALDMFGRANAAEFDRRGFPTSSARCSTRSTRATAIRGRASTARCR